MLKRRRKFGKYVLVVDDSKDILDIIAEQLETHGATAVCVTSADEALRTLTFCRFDLIISDYSMPEKTGLDLYRELKRRNIQIPFFFCSCLLADAAEKLVRDGKAGKLSKPILEKELEEMLAD